MATVQDYFSPKRPTWCPGCGNHAIWNALKRALVQLDLAPHEVMVITGIGCGSKIADYMHVNGALTLHGRTVPVASGFRLANHGMPVICAHGDGDGLSEGLGHMMHAARRNIGLVDIIQDNRIYGLTKGQFSPTSYRGRISRTSPWGAIAKPVQPLALALAAGATFVSRSWSGDVPHLVDTMVRAIEHRGYALVDVLQPCVTFNRQQSYDYYRPRVYNVEEEPGHDPTDLLRAFELAQDDRNPDRIPIGVLYQVEDDRPAFEDQVPALSVGPLVQQPLRQWSGEDFEALIAPYL